MIIDILKLVFVGLWAYGYVQAYDVVFVYCIVASVLTSLAFVALLGDKDKKLIDSMTEKWKKKNKAKKLFAFGSDLAFVIAVAWLGHPAMAYPDVLGLLMTTMIANNRIK